MRKKLASCLIGLAKWLSPVEVEERVPVVEDYEACRIGSSFMLTKREVCKFRKEHPELTSVRKGRAAAIEKVKGDIRLGIFKEVIEDGLIQFKVEKGNGENRFDTVIKGYLNVNVPKKIFDSVREREEAES